MADEFNPVDVNYVLLVDRSMEGGVEFRFDQQTVKFPPGKDKKHVPMVLARWLYSTADKHMVWAKATEEYPGGRFVHRFAVEDPPAELIQECGDEIADTSPIEIDRSRREGWNTDLADRAGMTMAVEALARSPRDFERPDIARAPLKAGL